MRVLHICPSFAPAYCYGGPIQSLLGLTKGLMQQGAEVRVLTTDCNGATRLAVENGWTTFDGVPVRYAHSWADRDFAPSLLVTPPSEIKWADVTHITGVFCSTSMWGIAAAKIARRPVMLSLRGVLEPSALAIQATRKRHWLRAFRSLLGRVDVFHTTSASETLGLRRVLGDVRVVEVPNGVFVGDFSQHTKSARPRVVALGRIHRVKGYLELVRAVAILRNRGLDVELQIAGPREDEAYAKEVEDEAERGGMRDCFSILGPLHGEAKSQFLASATVLALPSITENFGNVVVEALACSVPVVASQNTPWEILEREQCGRWVERTPHALADGLEPYLLDSAAAAVAGGLGRQLVERRYGWTEVARQMLDHYSAIC